MDAKTGLFYVFAAILLFAALRVITARNPVHAALYLVLAFFQAAAIWLLLRAEFRGVVAVLHLFAVLFGEARWNATDRPESPALEPVVRGHRRRDQRDVGRATGAG